MLFACRRYFLNPRLVLAVSVLAFGGAVKAAESYHLQANPGRNQARQVVALLEARGDLKLNDANNKVRKLPLEVRGDLKYVERLLAPNRSVRLYANAAAKIRIGEGGAKPSLRESRHLVLAQNGERMQYRAAQGPIRREELDVLRTQGDPLAVAELLPVEAVQVGEEWKASPDVWAKVLAIESVASQEIQFQLVKVEGDIALVSFEGRLDGAVGGVATEMQIRGKLNVDTKIQDITWFAMTIKEKRAIGVAEPGVEASSRLRVAVTHVPPVAEISPQAIAGMPMELDETDGILEFASKSMGFRVIYEPRWRLMFERPDFVVFRLVQDGELIGQANVSRLQDRPLDKPFKMIDFQRDIQQSLDKRFGQFVETTEFSTDAGANVLRVTASGAVEEVPIQWIYYHLTSEKGERLTISFTMAAKQAEAFAGADRTLINSVQILPLPKPSAAPVRSSDAGSGAR